MLPFTRIQFKETILGIINGLDDSCKCYGSFKNGTFHYNPKRKISYSDVDLEQQTMITTEDKVQLAEELQSEIKISVGIKMRVSVRRNIINREIHERMGRDIYWLAQNEIIKKSLENPSLFKDRNRIGYELAKYLIKTRYSEMMRSNSHRDYDKEKLGTPAPKIFDIKIGEEMASDRQIEEMLFYIYLEDKKEYREMVRLLAGNDQRKILIRNNRRLNIYRSIIPGIIADMRMLERQ